MYESHTGYGGPFFGARREVAEMNRSRLARESGSLLLLCMFALAAGVGCGANTTDDASDPPGVVTDPNAMQPGFTNPNGTIGGAGMGSTMLPNPMTGSGGSGSTGTNTNNPNVI